MACCSSVYACARPPSGASSSGRSPTRTASEDDVYRNAERILAAAVAQAGVSAEETVLPLPEHEALERVAEQAHAGLVVVGSRRNRRLGSTVQGSVASRMAGSGRTPTVTLPPSAQIAPGSGHYELLGSAA